MAPGLAAPSDRRAQLHPAMQALAAHTFHAGKEVCGGKCCDACNTAKTDCCNREFAGRHVHAGCGWVPRSACTVPVAHVGCSGRLP